MQAIGNGCRSDAFVKQRAERSQALKANFKADLRHAQAAKAKQLFRLGDPSLNQVLMRSGVESAAKETKEVIGREARLLRYFRQVQRQVIPFVHKSARAPKPLLKIGPLRDLIHSPGG